MTDDGSPCWSRIGAAQSSIVSCGVYVLWYLPFEALLVPGGEHGEPVPLIHKLKIRYAPTVGSQ